ncbi:cyclic nucleotide-gated ion channel [Ancylobacter lacus]|uniref:cyclic nucleotide-gated ion channel n=1 Tax=Ancylobacter lacus TaxID=2579970 RepID=UPI0031B83259
MAEPEVGSAAADIAAGHPRAATDLFGGPSVPAAAEQMAAVHPAPGPAVADRASVRSHPAGSHIVPGGASGGHPGEHAGDSGGHEHPATGPRGGHGGAADGHSREQAGDAGRHEHPAADSTAGHIGGAAHPHAVEHAGGAAGGHRGEPGGRPRRLLGRANRRRLYEILERDAAEDRAAEIVNRFLIALILLNTLSAALATVSSLALHDRIEFHAFEIVSLVLFVGEYAARVWVSPENPRYRGLSARAARQRYMASLPALIDLLAWLPFVLVMLFQGLDLRALAMLRLLRFAKLARYSPGMQSLLDVLRSERQSLLACFWLLSAAVLIAASAMYIAERDTQPDRFSSIPAAMWWAIATITTVGYGDVVPVTVAGRIVAGLTMIAGIITIALPVGIVATAFAEVIKRRDFVITWGMVARVPLFADLDAAGIGEIHRILAAHTCQPGEVVVRRGEVARSMYFIASGEVELDFADEQVLLGVGQFFGELALIHHARRAATARARGRAMLLMLDADDLADVIRRHPDIGRRIRASARELEPTPGHDKADIASHEIPPAV